ncbi:MAG: hypothetical protein ACLSHC_15760 [Bilophila wadsworthia]
MRKTTAGIVFLMILTLMCGAALAQTRVLATTFPSTRSSVTSQNAGCGGAAHAPRAGRMPLTITPSRRRT